MKSLKAIHNDQLLDYPRVSQKGKKKYLLSIFPEFHTRLFPDSILRNESFNVIEDVSHTNSIHKAYISFAPISNLNSGDLIVIYRTSDKKGPAKYRSVATSICVVEEMKSKSDFISSIDFIDYCKHSIFTTEELKDFMKNIKE